MYPSRRPHYADGKPSVQQLIRWIEEGEVIEKIMGGMYLVELQVAVMEANDPLLAQMIEIG